MPKDRNRKRNTRKVKKRLFILCEGEKTEYNYFTELVRSKNVRGRPITLKVVTTKRNTARELVEEAIKSRELPKDEAWAVFDKNGYTKHAEAFNKARSNDIKIAFSSISFEFWILIHFEYTTRTFHKSNEIIKYLKRYFDYKKNDDKIYEYLKIKTKVAEKHAKKVRKFQKETNPGHKIYRLNPYTNVDELINSINQKIKEYR